MDPFGVCGSIGPCNRDGTVPRALHHFGVRGSVGSGMSLVSLSASCSLHRSIGNLGRKSLAAQDSGDKGANVEKGRAGIKPGAAFAHVQLQLRYCWIILLVTPWCLAMSA